MDLTNNNILPPPIKRYYGSQYIFAYQDSKSAEKLRKKNRPCLSCNGSVAIKSEIIKYIENGTHFEIKLKLAQDYLSIHQRTAETITDSNKRKSNSNDDDVCAEKKLKLASTSANDNVPIKSSWDKDKTYLLPAKCNNNACPSTAIAVFYGYEITADGGYSYCPHEKHNKKYYTKDIDKFVSHLLDYYNIICMFCFTHMPTLKAYIGHFYNNLCDKHELQPMELLYSICEEPNCKEKILIPLGTGIYEYTGQQLRHQDKVHRICNIKNKISKCNAPTNQIIPENSKTGESNGDKTMPDLSLPQEGASNNSHSSKLEDNATGMLSKQNVIINVTNLNIDQQEILKKLGFTILFDENNRCAITEITNQNSAGYDLALLGNPIVIDVSHLNLEQLKIIDSIAEIDRYKTPPLVDISRLIRSSSPIILPENLSLKIIAADATHKQNLQARELVNQSVSTSSKSSNEISALLENNSNTQTAKNCDDFSAIITPSILKQGMNKPKNSDTPKSASKEPQDVSQGSSNDLNNKQMYYYSDISSSDSLEESKSIRSSQQLQTSNSQPVVKNNLATTNDMKINLMINITNLSEQQISLLSNLFAIGVADNKKYAFIEIPITISEYIEDDNLAFLNRVVAVDITSLNKEQVKIFSSIIREKIYVNSDNKIIVDISKFIRSSSPVILPENLFLETTVATPALEVFNLQGDERPQADVETEQNLQDKKLVNQTVSKSLEPSNEISTANSALLKNNSDTQLGNNSDNPSPITQISTQRMNIPQNSHIPKWAIYMLNK